MTLPNFIILGAAKAGTTALYHYLGQHPQVCMSRTKETNFLALMDDPLDFRGPGDRDYIARFSVTTLDGYREQFRGCEAKPAIGEASPLYLYSPKAPRLIGEFVPDAKLIAILRNPVDRAYSAFLHLVRDGRETVLDFGEALRREDERVRDGWEHIWHYRRMGCYFAQLDRYRQIFDPARITVCLHHDFKTKPIVVLRDLFRFLGVDESFTPTCRPNITTPASHRAQAALLPQVRSSCKRSSARTSRSSATPRQRPLAMDHRHAPGGRAGGHDLI
ncbi:MAG: sulfotransferase [Singulisphaera sp.]